MYKQFIKFASENMMLVAIMVCVTISIMSRSYFDLSYISPDSSHYLRAAREILNGNGFNVYPGWFAIWPIGYPALIALVAFITRTEIYLASKILSIIIVWIIGLLLYKRFGRVAWAFAFVMMNVGFRYIFFYTWSETVFILGLFLLAFTAVDIITENTVNASNYIRLTFILLLLFLSRYIGAFALSIVGLLWLLNAYMFVLKKDKIAGKRTLYLSLSGIISALSMIAYLLMNQSKTGHMTGIERVPAGPAREILLDLYRAMMIEMDYVFDTFFSIGSARLALLLWFILILFIIHTVSKAKSCIISHERNIITALSFIVIGVLYWIAIIFMRLTSDFDDFNFRLLFPGSSMLFIGFVCLLIRNGKIAAFLTRFSGKVIPVVCLTGFILMALVITPRLQGTSGYRHVKNAVLSTYSAIPDGALVLWGDSHLLFMRDNLHATRAILGTDVPSFYDEYNEYQEIYIFIPEMRLRLAEDEYLSSELYSYFAQYLDSQEEFVKIK